MDGSLSRQSVKPFTNPRQTLKGLNPDAASLVIAAAVDIAVIVDNAGMVCDVASGSEMQQFDAAERWIGLPMTACVSPDSVHKVEALLREGNQHSVSGWRQLNHPLPGLDDIPVLYSCASLGAEGRMVCLGRDLRPMAALQHRLLQAQQTMEREYARLRQAETRYRLLFQLCSEAVIVCEAVSQRIIEINPAAAELLGPGQKRLVGRQFPEGFDAESTPRVESLLATVRAAGRSDPIQAIVAQGDKAVSVHASLFRQDQMAHLLVRIIASQDVSAGRDAQQHRTVSLVEHLPDGFVVTNSAGRIRSANMAFLDLVEVASEEQVRGEELGRWLGRPGVDFPVLLSSIREHGTVRLFTSTMRGEFGASTEVEISAASTPDKTDHWMGFSIRAVQARLRPRSTRAAELPRSLEQLTDLIGRVPLKDLVRETTDVIERMCIESALHLSSDNRASAAEMLGLSRQSLYVKLHRYGLGDLPSQDGDDEQTSH